MAMSIGSAWHQPRGSAFWPPLLPSQSSNPRPNSRNWSSVNCKHIVGLNILAALNMLFDHAQSLFLKVAIANKVSFKVLPLLTGGITSTLLSGSGKSALNCAVRCSSVSSRCSRVNSASVTRKDRRLVVIIGRSEVHKLHHEFAGHENRQRNLSISLLSR